MNHIILHIDMDAFFTSVEQHDHPALRGKPVVVGAPPDKRGVVSAASYEARRFGIHSAMPSRIAFSKCPHATFLPVNFKRYEEVSDQITAVFLEVTKQIEPISLDEAFLDVSHCVTLFDEGIKLASRIKENIYKKTKLTASVGVATNKFIAKIASDFKKPNGFTVVREEQNRFFLRPLPVRKMWGVGPVTERFLKEKDLNLIGDLQKLSLVDLTAKIGTLAQTLYPLARGDDHSLVESDRTPKSVSREVTFEQDVTEPQLLFNVMDDLAEEVEKALQEEGTKGRTVVLKIRYSNFETHTRQITQKHPIAEALLLKQIGETLLDQSLDPTRPVRLIGLGVAQLSFPSEEDSLQMELFPSPF